MAQKPRRERTTFDDGAVGVVMHRVTCGCGNFIQQWRLIRQATPYWGKMHVCHECVAEALGRHRRRPRVNH